MKLLFIILVGLTAGILACSCDRKETATTKTPEENVIHETAPENVTNQENKPARTQPGPKQIQKNVALKTEPKEMPKRKPYIPLSDEELRNKLTPLQYEVTKHEATERPWTNKFDRHFEEGIYVCIISGEPLFSSKDKYDSGCGWPAFTKPIDGNEIESTTDFKIGYARSEVRAKTGNSHLGHVFPDGPKATGGLRYCVNSASMRFIPKDKLAEEGYGEYVKLFETGNTISSQ